MEQTVNLAPVNPPHTNAKEIMMQWFILQEFWLEDGSVNGVDTTLYGPFANEQEVDAAMEILRECVDPDHYRTRVLAPTRLFSPATV